MGRWDSKDRYNTYSTVRELQKDEIKYLGCGQYEHNIHSVYVIYAMCLSYQGHVALHRHLMAKTKYTVLKTPPTLPLLFHLPHNLPITTQFPKPSIHLQCKSPPPPRVSTPVRHLNTRIIDANPTLPPSSILRPYNKSHLSIHPHDYDAIAFFSRLTHERRCDS